MFKTGPPQTDNSVDQNFY